jgi:hypothetical protein
VSVLRTVYIWRPLEFGGRAPSLMSHMPRDDTVARHTTPIVSSRPHPRVAPVAQAGSRTPPLSIWPCTCGNVFVLEGRSDSEGRGAGGGWGGEAGYAGWQGGLWSCGLDETSSKWSLDGAMEPKEGGELWKCG